MLMALTWTCKYRNNSIISYMGNTKGTHKAMKLDEIYIPSLKGSFKIGDLVVEESHVYHFPPIKVSLEADFPAGKDEPLLQEIKSAFQREPSGKQSLPAYTLIDDPSQSALRLYLLRPKRKNGQLIRAKADDALPKSFANQPPELWILTQEQRLLDIIPI